MKPLDRDLLFLKHVTQLEPQQNEALIKSLKKIKILTPDFANTKTAKNSQFEAYESYILHLSPADIAFKYISKRGTLCPMASQGCKAACLNTAGRGRFNSVQRARLRKSLYYILFNDLFMSRLETELTKLEKKASQNGKKLVVRLNGTSDILWSVSLFEKFSNVQFYDYTAIPKLIRRSAQIENHYVVFSAKENNEETCLEMVQEGFNVAMVFDKIPKQYKGFDVLNGDNHDFRFLDMRQGVIVGLKAKGDAKRDTSGFVRQVSQNEIPPSQNNTRKVA